MVWPSTYGEEDIEIYYNTSNKASRMKMIKSIHGLLKCQYLLTQLCWIITWYLTRSCFTTRRLNLLFCLSSSAYNDTVQEGYPYHNCTKGKYFIQNTFSAPDHTKWSCPFMKTVLGPCSGLEDPTFGYNCTMPCVIIKMNRVRLTHKYLGVLRYLKNPPNIS